VTCGTVAALGLLAGYVEGFAPRSIVRGECLRRKAVDGTAAWNRWRVRNLTRGGQIHPYSPAY
jgi:hypothetical protein